MDIRQTENLNQIKFDGISMQLKALGQGFCCMLNLENNHLDQSSIDVTLNQVRHECKHLYLKSIVLTGNKCYSIPQTMVNLTALERLFINGNELRDLFDASSDASILKCLDQVMPSNKSSFKKDVILTQLESDTTIPVEILEKVVFLIKLKSLDATFNVFLSENGKQILNRLNQLGAVTSYSKIGTELNEALQWNITR
ncbi:MAG: hypothetical protein VW397_03825 [Candidatus Margulisiibacteriota bacterium]